VGVGVGVGVGLGVGVGVGAGVVVGFVAVVDTVVVPDVAGVRFVEAVGVAAPPHPEIMGSNEEKIPTTRAFAKSLRVTCIEPPEKLAGD
jgi:hypothetical protein